MSSSASSSLIRPKTRAHRPHRKGTARKMEKVGVGLAALTSQRIVQPVFPLTATLNNNVFNIIQSFPTGSIPSSATLPSFATVTHTFAGLDQTSQLASVFDQYRIRLIEVCFRPHSNDQPTAVNFDGIFSTVIDYDDATVLATAAQAQDYASVLNSEGYEAQRRCYVPHIAVAAYSGAFTSFANEEAPWIDTSSAGVIHYGIKTAWTVTSAVCTYDVFSRAWFQFRNVR